MLEFMHVKSFPEKEIDKRELYRRKKMFAKLPNIENIFEQGATLSKASYSTFSFKDEMDDTNFGEFTIIQADIDGVNGYFTTSSKTVIASLEELVTEFPDDEYIVERNRSKQGKDYYSLTLK